MQEPPFETTIGSFGFRDTVGDVARVIRVHFVRPPNDIGRAPIVIAMHGLDRAAKDFRDVMIAGAQRNGQIVLVPEFDPHQFPGIHAYNFGGVRLPPPVSTVLPREQWTFGVIDRLFAFARRALRSDRTDFDLFGNSAGAQFVLRYLALSEAPNVDRVVAANSGIYMLPELGIDYPTGMGGIGLAERDLRRFLTRRLVIALGEHDCDPNAHDLPRGEAADAQGPHRLARGRWYIGHCADLATRLGVTLGWQHEIIPGAGHVSQEVYDRASDILAR